MLWECARCETVHTQNPAECRACGHRIFDALAASEYERQTDAAAPVAVDDAITMGTTPDPDYDSSPDVAVDGSVEREEAAPTPGPDADSQPGGVLQRVRRWLF